MARGRKRLIAGRGLVGLGVVVCLVLVASRWYSLNHRKSTGGWYASLAHGTVEYGPFLIVNGSIRSADLIERNRLVGLEWFVAPEGYGKTTSFHTPIFVVERARGIPWPYIQFPLWPIALLAAFFGGVTVAWGRAIRNLAPDGCEVCGYDMKGLAVGAGCPECGATR